MENWKKDRIASALDGSNPTVLAKMKSGFAVFGDTQFLPGYCVLLGYPKVFSLNDLSIVDRTVFLTDMTLIGDAITSVFNPLRINYDILGNLDTYLHAHIFPRYEWEDDELRKGPVMLYPKENWTNPSEEQYHSHEKFLDVRSKLQSKLEALMISTYV